MRAASFVTLLLLSACAGQQVAFPPPPETPAQVIDNAVCVSCGWLLEEEELAQLVAQAQKGNAEAAFRVALHYSSADEPETHQAWLRRAALLGHSVAQYNKWFLLREASSCAGRAEALMWVEKAAGQGYPEALRKLPDYRGNTVDCSAEPSVPGNVPPNNSSKPTPLRGAA